MTLEHKIALCSGASFFSTVAFDQYGIPSITMADGPHGLRKQVAIDDRLGIHRSVPATCFPTASLTACSWDRALLREIGAAIGEEALQEGVSIVLGPGANVKRNPLCGRSFEYYSEDPYLAGELAAAWIDGLQSQGVGASLKHFAANSQESERMASDSIVDERTLREIYLSAFEKAVKRAAPATVMCAYNKLNGVHCSDHRYLLRDILRDEWGFGGVIVTDWGAMNDRVKATEAGLDLEMPGSKGHFDETVLAAVQSGELPGARLDESVDRLLDLILALAANRRAGYRYDVDRHHALAQRAAAHSAVLLKNEGGILPIEKGKRIALIGALARDPRYQGAGSSHVVPTRLCSAVDGFDALGLRYAYLSGYPLVGPGDERMRAEAAAGARESDVAVIFAGLPQAYESEGYDRTTLAMPDSHNALIARVAEANPDTVVVLVGGAPVEMPWISKVKAVLNTYLSGQAGGLAAAELLVGAVNPSGKLAESYPVSYADVPSAGFYETGGKQAQYREGIYVGYRYYDKARKDVLYPFGHGLSYTTFAYSDLAISDADLEAPYELGLSLTVENTGGVAGAEVVQVYVGDVGQAVHRPDKELKGFAKLYLEAGESARVHFTLDARSFAFYDVKAGDWVVPGGIYTFSIGASSRDLRLQADVKVRGSPVQPERRDVSTWYRNPTGKVTQADFESLLGGEIAPVKPWRKGAYTLACSFQDMQDSLIVRQIVKRIEKAIRGALGGVDDGDPAFRMAMAGALSTPLKNLSLMDPDHMPRHVAVGIVHVANGRFLRGMRAFACKPKSTKQGPNRPQRHGTPKCSRPSSGGDA
ncbi:MAG: glycoside hydrolase family 3 C-terminal domain-containing protein [Anaerolineae bacterium]|nr:glycoside hydrolase family 3 C-terminal domain-containing protein [Anaerolineae bacterium]